jgi:hypothetical protein
VALGGKGLTVREEIERRAGFTSAVLDYFMAHPLEWIDVHTLAHVAGFAAWRTRVSDARKVVKRDGGDILWNHEPRNSCYRYHPQAPIGRDAGEQVQRCWDTDGPFTALEMSALNQQVLRFK